MARDLLEIKDIYMPSTLPRGKKKKQDVVGLFLLIVSSNDGMISFWLSLRVLKNTKKNHNGVVDPIV